MQMHVVYVGESAAGKGLQSRVATPVPYSVPEGGIGPPFAHTMQFDAGFESGNLLRAVQRDRDLFNSASDGDAGMLKVASFFGRLCSYCSSTHFMATVGARRTGAASCSALDKERNGTRRRSILLAA